MVEETKGAAQGPEHLKGGTHKKRFMCAKVLRKAIEVRV